MKSYNTDKTGKIIWEDEQIKNTKNILKLQAIRKKERWGALECDGIETGR